MEPNSQHYRNPLKWGWYYVVNPDGRQTGLMSKLAARHYITVERYQIAYGMALHKHSMTPVGLSRYFTFPRKSG